MDYTSNNSLDKAEKKLRRYSFHSKMEMCRKLSHSSSFSQFSNENFLQNIVPTNKSTNKKIRDTLYLHHIAYLSLLSAVSGEWAGHLKELEEYKQIRELVNYIGDHNVPFVHPKDSDEDYPIGNMFYTRTALQQFKFQESLQHGFYRYWYLYNNENKEFSAKQYFKDTFTYDFDDYIKFTLCVYLLSNASEEPLTVHKLKTWMSNIGSFSNEKIDCMIRNLSMSRETCTEKYEEFKSKDREMRIYDYNPFLAKAVIKQEDVLYLPVPSLLSKSITEGFYHILCSKNKKFRELFGKYTYEDYIFHLFESEGYTVIKEFDYYIKKQQFKSSDAILIKGNDLILVEVKGNSPSVPLRCADLNTYENEMNRAHVKAILQCYKKEEHIRNKILKHDDFPKQINRISYLSVTLEEFHLFNPDLLKKMLMNSGAEKCINKCHTMGSATLEGILERDSRDLFEFLHYREDEGALYKGEPDTQINNEKKNKKNKDSYIANELLKEMQQEVE